MVSLLFPGRARVEQGQVPLLLPLLLSQQRSQAKKAELSVESVIPGTLADPQFAAGLLVYVLQRHREEGVGPPHRQNSFSQ
jgi:hypothetical protein